ncbi:MAG: 3-dehydroquinate dehydratase [Flavobacteriales bacterium]|nr:3-dehydroquinate dehydratase [Flavobacteriales bacterium]
MSAILVINGPNLGLLGSREPHLYGTRTLQEVMDDLSGHFPDARIDHYQSDLEGELITAIHGAAGKYVGIVLNPGGYGHTSVALRDAVAASKVPVIEVHLTNLLAREPFRHVSLVGGVCIGSIMGLGAAGYRWAAAHFLEPAA